MYQIGFLVSDKSQYVVVSG